MLSSVTLISHEYTIWTKVLDNGKGNFSYRAHFRICKLNVLNTQFKTRVG